MKKYLITGAAGHLGNVIVQKISKFSNNIRVLLLENPKDVPYLPDNIEKVVGDITDIKSLDDFFKNPNNDELIVIHCAGIVTIKSKYVPKVYEVNVNGTKNIVNECIKNKVKKLIYISSVHAIEENKKGIVINETLNFDSNKVIGLYAKTKCEATKYVLDSTKEGLDASVIHPAGIVGPYDYSNGHLTQLAIDYLNSKLTAIVDGGYDFVDVRDVASGIINCIEKGRKGECYILSNEYHTVKEFIDTLSKVSGKKTIKTVLPLWFVKIVAPFAEVYYDIMKQTPLFTNYSIYTLNSNSLFSHEKAEKELDYKPRSFENTLNDTYKWLKDNNRV